MSWPMPTRRPGPNPAALRGPAITARDQQLIAEHRAHQPSSSARNGQSSSAPHLRRFPCPFADCSRGYNELIALKTHKAAEHDYCKICDIDFKDDEAFHVHKMQSEKHITCPMCSVDFQSEAGRNRHFKQVKLIAVFNVSLYQLIIDQMHSTQQNIKCRGCQEIFPRGGGLMMHLENNGCKATGFNNPTLQQNRAMMEIHMEGVTQLIREDSEAGMPSIGASAAGDTTGGGVLLDEPYDILNEEEDQSQLDSVHPTLAAKPAQDESDSDESYTTEIGAPSESNAASSVWPLIPKEKKSKPKEDLTNKFEKLTVGAQLWNKKLFPNAPRTPASGYLPPTHQQNQDSINPVSGERNNFPVLDLKPDPIDNLYHCPFPKCQ